MSYGPIWHRFEATGARQGRKLTIRWPRSSGAVPRPAVKCSGCFVIYALNAALKVGFNEVNFAPPMDAKTRARFMGTTNR